jgi:hypothetical protein
MKWVARSVAVAVWLSAVVLALADLGIVPLEGTGLALPFVAVPGFGTVGLALILHRPANSVGWLMLGMGGAPAVFFLAGVGGVEFQNLAVLAALVLVLVVFPDGRLPSRRWLVPIALLVVGWVIALLVPSFEWRSSDDFAVPIGVVAGLAGVLWCAAAPFIRFRRADGIERAQLRWLGATAAFAAIMALVALATGVAGVPVIPELAALLGMATGALGIPAAILVAVTRYRLYEIDRIVSRTVTYALVVLVVGAVYAVPVVLLPRLLGESNDLVIAGSTLASAAAFNPVRRRIQRGVDHRFNRAHYDAEQEVEAFAGRLRGSADLAAVSTDLAGVLGRTVAPTGIGVWLRSRT